MVPSGEHWPSSRQVLLNLVLKNFSVNQNLRSNNALRIKYLNIEYGTVQVLGISFVFNVIINIFGPFQFNYNCVWHSKPTTTTNEKFQTKPSQNKRISHSQLAIGHAKHMIFRVKFVWFFNIIHKIWRIIKMVVFLSTFFTFCPIQPSTFKPN